jgi:hypothetical protein
MNRAYKHIETSLRIGDFTLAQWGCVILGIAIGIAWGFYLSPFGRTVTIFTTVWGGGLPVALALVASASEFDFWLYLRAFLRWRRRRDRFIPGAGAVHGYVLDIPDEPASRNHRAALPDLDPAQLWD